MAEKFILHSEYKPAGDQPQAIKSLVNNIHNGVKDQVLLGVTGSGKTYTIANVIEQVNKPTLVLAHNKTLAGQLYGELKELFPENHVEYFVSYYDYYQPEAYVAKTDTYIAKDASINDEIDELRHSATASLMNYSDVIVVASVSCIYGIGEIEDYKNSTITIKAGEHINRDDVLEKLVEMLYERNDFDLKRGSFRVHGDVLEVVPVSEHSKGIRVDFFGDEVDKIIEFDTLTGNIIQEKKSVTLFPATHFVTSKEKMKIALKNIRQELDERLDYFKSNNKLLEYQRLKERTNYDLEMLEETGFCRGVENYSGPLSLRPTGATPTTLLDFFPKDFLMVIDESHVTLPQVRGMYNGDRMRKQVLVDYGFRLPSALDNRPLKFEEFIKKQGTTVYMSATPGDYEIEKSNKHVVEQLIRPTGLLDPTLEVRPTKNEIDDIVSEINDRIAKHERVMITTLTIHLAEELTNYLKNLNIKVAYLYSEVKTLERMKIIRDLRLGKYDVLVGINLLREGLDIPEVSLICILDADKEGFLRSNRSLIQIIGRAARNSEGHVIMYADHVSDAMQVAINETNRRRKIQEEYNREHNIVPKTIIKAVRDLISNNEELIDKKPEKLSSHDKKLIMANLEDEMKQAARDFDFERAAVLRDALFEMRSSK